MAGLQQIPHGGGIQHDGEDGDQERHQQNEEPNDPEHGGFYDRRWAGSSLSAHAPMAASDSSMKAEP